MFAVNKNDAIYLAGHTGMVGSATMFELRSRGYNNIITSAPDYDLRRQSLVEDLFARQRPRTVIVAAARVGGIVANSKYPHDFISDNLEIQTNLINTSLRHGIKRLIFLGSSCIYPKLAPQPLREEYLLTGSLEPTNEWYATAKISGIKLCQAANKQYGVKYVSLMPTNLYGERDNFDLESSHVLPAMLRKFHEALPDIEVVLWGSGNPKREFMHVSDLARAICFFLEGDYEEDLYNVGTGGDITISDLAHMIQMIVGHKGKIYWDTGRPDGTPRKLLDVSRITKIGWSPKIDLEQGIIDTYRWMKENIAHLREVKHGL